MKSYQIVRCRPVAKFYYKGSHSHPVRRTVLVIESNSRWIRGYELREGDIERRATTKAPIKTYSRNKIAKIGQCGRRLKNRTPKNLHNQITLIRQSTREVFVSGI